MLVALSSIHQLIRLTEQLPGGQARTASGEVSARGSVRALRLNDTKRPYASYAYKASGHARRGIRSFDLVLWPFSENNAWCCDGWHYCKQCGRSISYLQIQVCLSRELHYQGNTIGKVVISAIGSRTALVACGQKTDDPTKSAQLLQKLCQHGGKITAAVH